VSSFNITMIGPVLIQFGTDEQKRRFLPRAANIDDWWCQGFSEPGAGSDLASLRTAARREDGHYVVNGQKIWTSTAHHADWCFCLVRTDFAAKRRQEGISFLLIDMKTPGITVRPIISIDGSHHLNEVFFDEVRVPVENLVGEENKGWDVAKISARPRTHRHCKTGQVEGAGRICPGKGARDAGKRQAADRRPGISPARGPD
jgi:alkylation response protein AidB-like acyl-CoA dehydrogenase